MEVPANTPPVVADRIAPKRFAAVGLALIAVGAVAGGIAGAAGAAIWLAVTGHLRDLREPFVWALAAMIGAPFGAVLLPLAGLSGLRYVPIGILLLTNTVGTALGAAVAAALSPRLWLIGALAGFSLTALGLWRRYRPSQ